MATGKFYSSIIDGVEFQAVMSGDGPYITKRPLGNGVAIGQCTSIRFLQEPEFYCRNRRPHWAVVKYGNQERIDLSDLSARGRKRLSKEFGVPIGDSNPMPVMLDLFYKSAAFQGLCEWAQKHPGLFSRYSGFCNYLYDWPDKTTAVLQKAKATTKP